MADVVVVGGANIDIKAKAEGVHRLGTSNPGSVSTTAGGVGRNIAYNLGRLGARVSLISAVGQDSYGDLLLRQTGLAGVDVSHVRQESYTTGTYVAVLDDEGELISAVSDMRVLETLTPGVVADHRDLLKAAKFIVADCNLPLETLAYLASEFGHKLAVEPVSVQKSKKLLQVLKQSPVFVATPNLDQIDALFGSRDFSEAAVKLHQLGLQNVVIHAGSEGAFVSQGDDIDHASPRIVEGVVDVTGAGDAAMSGLIFGLLEGENLLRAAELGQALAARVIASTDSALE